MGHNGHLSLCRPSCQTLENIGLSSTVANTLMMNEEWIVTISNFHFCQVTINYQLSQKLAEPKSNAPQAQLIADTLCNFQNGNLNSEVIASLGLLLIAPTQLLHGLFQTYQQLAIQKSKVTTVPDFPAVSWIWNKSPSLLYGSPILCNQLRFNFNISQNQQNVSFSNSRLSYLVHFCPFFTQSVNQQLFNFIQKPKEVVHFCRKVGVKVLFGRCESIWGNFGEGWIDLGNLLGEGVVGTEEIDLKKLASL